MIDPPSLPGVTHRYSVGPMLPPGYDKDGLAVDLLLISPQARVAKRAPHQ
jgi:hypothetical protein